jgi:3-methyladenine DNA glycosylase/8-oxoguanine DNA glycosylase
LLATDGGALRWIGISRAKAAYLRDLAERLLDGRLDPTRLQNHEDETPGQS